MRRRETRTWRRGQANIILYCIIHFVICRIILYCIILYYIILITLRFTGTGTDTGAPGHGRTGAPGCARVSLPLPLPRTVYPVYHGQSTTEHGARSTESSTESTFQKKNLHAAVLCRRQAITPSLKQAKTKHRLVEPTSTSNLDLSQQAAGRLLPTPYNNEDDDDSLATQLQLQPTHTLHSLPLLMATATYSPGHSYPPLPPISHDMNPSETDISSTTSFAKHRYPPDDDNDYDTEPREPNPFPKDLPPQWDQPPPPLELQRPARKWWQRVRLHTNYLSYPFPFSLSPN